jgi:ATP-dependent DNA helicase RecQ
MLFDPLKALQEYWGHDAFRPMQEDIIRSVLRGDDTLALLPTGGGKSICFQVPALCKEGICIVVSPLIALMKDQVHNLKRRNINAEAIYSGMHFRDIDRILDNCVYGNIKFLYLSPERLTTDIVKARLALMNVCLLAIDEAHCISQWGYDFRPPYLKIAEIRSILYKTPVIALTATATEPVVADIQEKLGFRQTNIFQQSFVRDNLSYVVQHEIDKYAKMLSILQKVTGSSVVYVRNRKQTKDIADWLNTQKISASHYHAGLPPDERSRLQDEWITNRKRVIVSTNAFGMGIDKPDVRTVIHLDLPETLEAYFQEAGRAGRDGKRAYAVLLYNATDREKLERDFMISFPPVSEIKRVYHALGSYFQIAIGAGEGQSFDFEISDFTKKYAFDILKTFHSLRFLESAGWITMTEAVYTPASVQIILGKDDWYNYLLKNKELEPLLKALVRAYESIWNTPVRLDDYKLAGFLRVPVDKLLTQLTFLHQEKVIDYIPRNDKPQLTMLRERAALDNLNISDAMYEFRRKRHEEKMYAALAYAETEVCRSLQLIRYFGEKTTRKCGKCDICIAQRKTLQQNAEFEVIRFRIQEILEREKVDTSFLVRYFSSLQTDFVLEIVNFFLDEGKIVEDDDGILHWQV